MSDSTSVPLILFWLSLFMVAWTYYGYLLTLKIISMFYTRAVARTDSLPAVTMVITAHNEERRLAEKIENSLDLDYPRDRLEIVVVSDGSTDRTCEIARSYVDRGIKLVTIPERHGKHYGQGKGVALARSDLVILSDATTFLKPDAAKKIISGFADPSVGCVSGVDQLRSADSAASGEGLYVRYEMYLRSLESKVGSLVGVSGCFFAVRKDICREWIDNMSADFYLPSMARILGYRTILEPEAVGSYEVVQDQRQEFQRKVRTVVHGMEVLFRFKKVLNPFRYGAYAMQMISHKLSRWLVPLYLTVMAFSNVILWDQGLFYRLFLGAQVIFYLLAVLALSVPRLRRGLIMKIPAFFVIANWSIVVSWYYFFAGKDFVTWDATKR